MPRKVTGLQVRRTERLSPHMIRVVAGGDDLAAFPDTAHTDRYVKILFPRPGVAYPKPFDMDAVRAAHPREQWPVVRTYTIRSLDLAAGELTIDFVHHGDVGLAGPWAAAAQPGDPLLLLGPGGAYAPDPTADWHLLVGDESALPAIGAALERVPAGVPVTRSSRSTGPPTSWSWPVPAGWTCAGATATPVAPGSSSTYWRRCRSRRAACTRSSTARPASCAPCASTWSTSAVCRATTCPCRATGAAATTRRTSASSRRPSAPPRAEG